MIFGNKNIDGCKWLHSKQMLKLKKWILPDWLILVEYVLSFKLAFLLLVLLLIFAGLFKRLRREFPFLIFLNLMLMILSKLIKMFFLIIKILKIINDRYSYNRWTIIIRFKIN